MLVEKQNKSKKLGNTNTVSVHCWFIRCSPKVVHTLFRLLAFIYAWDSMEIVEDSFSPHSQHTEQQQQQQHQYQRHKLNQRITEWNKILNVIWTKLCVCCAYSTYKNRRYSHSVFSQNITKANGNKIGLTE